MDRFEHKSISTKPYDLTYSYYLSPDFHKRTSVPTLVFCHGYPDDAYMWAGAVKHLVDLPYRIVLVDILGFGGSSKPKEASKYRYKQQADSIAQILDNEGVKEGVIPIGHDWGSATVQRLYLYHRDRCIGLGLISLAYQIPSDQPFDLVTANKETAKRFGYPQWEYWNFFNAKDATDLMDKHIQRFLEVNNGNFPSPKPEENGRDIWMREMFCVPNAMREYVTGTGKYEGFTVDLKPYAKTPEFQKSFKDRLSRDGFEGPVNYYHSLTDNHNLEDEKQHLSTREAKTISVPVLYIGQTGDWVCRTDLMGDAKEAGLVSDVEEKVIQAGHWCLYEKPEEIAGLIKDWLQRRFPVKS
ncbi:hypothetical protein LTR78_004265 [Recurvomyces mirabilis]|uniref:AB hydrolase-1 domain-containing protein n=1 Tax=Recurvomyces mirabilis TaxID=574656 RepID=A0AAE0WQE5_9PEZI|nr:hypothetical protein LTR78_004265 [Recurvomyces mirabilis]KAK5153564.1 hypothetical protein LTS14_007258 [Recurvomyces mirabilis]